MANGHERLDERGCSSCPLDSLADVNKIFGKTVGKEIFVWAQNPGREENEQEKELVGRSGECLWSELKRVEIERRDCDIQNVVRCMTCDPRMRAPTKEEIRCCSIFNEEALKKSKAKLHLVFGAIAAKVLLKNEFGKDKRAFYSHNMGGSVIYLYHPSYLIRRGWCADTKRAASPTLKIFRGQLAAGLDFYKSQREN
jgi:uracil-DNA glycosylase family 4